MLSLLLLLTLLSVEGAGFVCATARGAEGRSEREGWLTAILLGSRCTDTQGMAVENNQSNNLLPFSAKTQNFYSFLINYLLLAVCLLGKRSEVQRAVLLKIIGMKFRTTDIVTVR